jgi:predicted  nucleic acid-binding Zn-ribbon protein
MARDLPKSCTNCGSSNIVTSNDGVKTKCRDCRTERWEIVADDEPGDAMKSLTKSPHNVDRKNQAAGFANEYIVDVLGGAPPQLWRMRK